MSRFVFIVYLASLAFLPALISAQSCSTTGTYADCCPSSNKKIVTFEGKDYRVYCDVAITQHSVVYTNTPGECATSCGGSIEECVDASWEPPRYCQKNELTSEAQNLAIVPMASAGPTQCDQDLQKCQTDLAARQADLATCQRSLSTEQANCAAQVSAEKQTCAAKLSTEQQNCATKVSTEKQNCAAQVSAERTSCAARISSALAQCQGTVASAGLRCRVSGGNSQYYQITLSTDPTSCKQNCLADSRCLSYAVGVGYYNNYCTLYGQAVNNLQLSTWQFLISDRNCP